MDYRKLADRFNLNDLLSGFLEIAQKTHHVTQSEARAA